MSIAPGHIALTRIPLAASSIAATRVSPTMAALVAAYEPTHGHARQRHVRGGVDDRAAARRLDLGRDRSIPRNAPTWLTWTTCWNSSSGVLTSSLKRRMPALLTSPSIVPKASFAAATAAAQSSSRLTSRWTYRGRLLAHLLGHGPALLVQHVREDHLRALGGEEPRLLLALPARRARDDDDASVQLAHVRTPSVVEVRGDFGARRPPSGRSVRRGSRLRNRTWIWSTPIAAYARRDSASALRLAGERAAPHVPAGLAHVQRLGDGADLDGLGDARRLAQRAQPGDLRGQPVPRVALRQPAVAADGRPAHGGGRGAAHPERGPRRLGGTRGAGRGR